MKQILRNIQLQRESKSFVDCLYAVITAAKLWEGPKYRLSGMMGMAFKFSVHKKLLHMSVTAYGGWIPEHAPAGNNLGIASTIDAGHTRHPTYNLYKEAAIHAIKQSIDKGIGTIFWQPEFCVIHGYDDTDQVFYYLDGNGSEAKVLLYQNFGLNFTPYWYSHIVHGSVEREIADIYLFSLRSAVDEWEIPHRTLPDKQVASGQLAYSFLLDAIHSGDYEVIGGAYILTTAIHAKKEIVAYLSEVEQVFPHIYSALIHYRKLKEIYMRIEQMIALRSNESLVEAEIIPKLLAEIKAAAETEDQAIQAIKLFLANYQSLEKQPIPRWGSSSPR